MKFDSGTYNDVAKYYKGSFVKFPQTGDYLCTVDSVDPSRIVGKIFSPDANGSWAPRPYQLPFGEGVEIDFVLPKKSYFNYKGRALFLYRIPARQYRKGITTENTSVMGLGEKGGWNPTIPDFDMLTAYVNKQLFLPFGTNAKSYAVAARMAVTKCGYLYIDKVRIGTVDMKKKEIMVRDQLFVHEVEKVLQVHSQSFKVVVGQLPKEELPQEEVEVVKWAHVPPPPPAAFSEQSINDLFEKFVNAS